jgi:hypothetical protein
VSIAACLVLVCLLHTGPHVLSGSRRGSDALSGIRATLLLSTLRARTTRKKAVIQGLLR